MNENNKYFYANRWYTFSYTFHEIFSIFFFVFMFNFIPLIMAFKHTIKPIWLTLLIPINPKRSLEKKVAKCKLV
ncbi:hypothetical protein SAMN05216518_13229 [Bacteroidales bacterium KHT7]|nr:hypothetical protein SAMN05216518_13229 [Bacteroidales bacterium KHT7]